MWSHQESNLDLEFRKLLFYPLNYETKRAAKIGNLSFNQFVHLTY